MSTHFEVKDRHQPFASTPLRRHLVLVSKRLQNVKHLFHLFQLFELMILIFRQSRKLSLVRRFKSFVKARECRCARRVLERTARSDGCDEEFEDPEFILIDFFWEVQLAEELAERLALVV